MIGYYEEYDKRKYKFLCKQLKNVGCPMHFHGEMELSYILSGTHEIYIGNDVFYLTEGDIYFCNPFEVHKCFSKECGEHILFTIRPFEYAPINDFLKGLIPNFLGDKDFNLRIFSILKEILLKQQPLNGLEKQGYIGLVLGEIVSRYGYKSEKKAKTDNIEDLLLYINHHYKEKLTRDTIARKFGYSSNYLSKLFKERFHCGLLEYINNLKYERTIAELSVSHATVTEIALKNGFDNVQSFYRINKKKKDHFSEVKLYHDFSD